MYVTLFSGDKRATTKLAAFAPPPVVGARAPYPAPGAGRGAAEKKGRRRDAADPACPETKFGSGKNGQSRFRYHIHFTHEKEQAPELRKSEKLSRQLAIRALTEGAALELQVPLHPDVLQRVKEDVCQRRQLKETRALEVDLPFVVNQEQQLRASFQLDGAEHDLFTHLGTFQEQPRARPGHQPSPPDGWTDSKH